MVASQKQWDNISIDEGNEYLTAATLHCAVNCDNGHHWDGGEVTKKATCKEEGVTTYTCTACGETKTESIAKLTSHSYDSGKVTKAATCKAEGVKTYTCTGCGATKTESIAKLTTHTPGAPATATNDQTCTVCGKVLAKATGETTPPTEAPTKAPTQAPTVAETQPVTQPSATDEPTQPEASTAPTQQETAPVAPTEPATDSEPSTDNTVLIVVIAVVISFGGGVAVGVILGKKKR